MKQQTAPVGAVRDGVLTFQQEGREMSLLVDSPAWFHWLESATSFTFHAQEGHFSARQTSAGNRRGGSYWRATRRVQGRLLSFYLGKTPRLTLQRLQEAARHLQAVSHAAGTSSPSARASAASALTDPLLLTKLSPPLLPGEYVARPHLLTLLHQGVQRPVTLISAPAGSGKTTLLAAWVRTAHIPVAWLSCEEADDDPARWLSYLTAALARLAGRSVGRAQRSGALLPNAWEHALIYLLNDVSGALAEDAALVLDDVHLLTPPGSLPALHFLLEHLPARLHVILGTRADPPLPLARLRALNHLSELRLADLSFTVDEVAEFVRGMGLRLEDEALELLEERTEGWIAGIQLLTLALRGQADSVAFLRASGKPHRFLVEYVEEDILARQHPQMQQFLLQTCLLERLTGPLCEAVTLQNDGSQRLSELRRANLFLSELDESRNWYRYHPLFAGALRAHLEALQPELIPLLYQRASAWYEQQQWYEEACDYAFRAGDLRRAATLLQQLLPLLLGQGKFQRLGWWLEQLPASLTAEFPLLALASLVRAYILQRSRQQFQQAEETRDKLLAYVTEQMGTHEGENSFPWRFLQAGLPLMRALTSWTEDDPGRIISLIRAASLLPAQTGDAWAQMLTLGRQVLLGVAYGASGDLKAAVQALLETTPERASRTTALFDMLIMFLLTELYEAQGQLHALERLYEQFFQRQEDQDSLAFPLRLIVHVRYAHLLYEWNRLDEAEQLLLKVRASEGGEHTPVSRFYLLSRSLEARLALARGEDEQARRLLTAEYALWQGMVGQLAGRTLGTSMARLALAWGQFALAEEWEVSSDLHFDDPLTMQFTNRDYLPYVTLVRLLLARARLRASRPALVQALSLLNRLRVLVREIDADGCFLEVQVLTALALHMQGSTKQALKTLGEVLPLAEKEGYVRLLVDEGQPLRPLLDSVGVYTTASQDYLQRLRDACGEPVLTELPEHAESRQPLPEPLSQREREVLALLAEGYANQQIAEQLVISLHTVKLHVKHILLKLTVANRTQAVTRARELRLL